MTRAAFTQLFALPSLRPCFCGYVGIFTIHLQAAEPDSWKSGLLRAAQAIEMPANLVMRRLPHRLHPGTGWASPYLMYVGEKLAASA